MIIEVLAVVVEEPVVLSVVVVMAVVVVIVAWLWTSLAARYMSVGIICYDIL